MCCIQETHLNSNHRFSIRGYETFRRDRESGPKGRLLILVKKKSPSSGNLQKSLESYSLSALQSLTSETPDASQKRLMDNINELAQSTKVVLQWIPAHTGIAGNEIVKSVGKGRQKKRSAFLTSVIQRNKNLDPQ